MRDSCEESILRKIVSGTFHWEISVLSWSMMLQHFII